MNTAPPAPDLKAPADPDDRDPIDPEDRRWWALATLTGHWADGRPDVITDDRLHDLAELAPAEGDDPRRWGDEPAGW